jgi:SAM-dependent methyltransferase
MQYHVSRARPASNARRTIASHAADARSDRTRRRRALLVQGSAPHRKAADRDGICRTLPARGRRVVAGSVAALPFADDSVDLATSFDVLYCLDDGTERLALREMWRVLKPGGLVLVNVAALDVLRGSHSTLTHEVRRYTPRRLRERLTTAGFRVERLTFTNATPFPVALAVRSVQRMTGRAADASEADLEVPPWPVNAAFNAALSVEAAILRLTNLPIGTSIMAVGRKMA